MMRWKKTVWEKQFVSKDPGPVVYTTNAPDGLLMANQGIYLNGQIRSDVMLVQKKGNGCFFKYGASDSFGQKPLAHRTVSYDCAVEANNRLLWQQEAAS